MKKLALVISIVLSVFFITGLIRFVGLAINHKNEESGFLLGFCLSGILVLGALLLLIVRLYKYSNRKEIKLKTESDLKKDTQRKDYL